MHENSEKANARNLPVSVGFSALRSGKFLMDAIAAGMDSKIFLHLWDMAVNHSCNSIENKIQ